MNFNFINRVRLSQPRLAPDERSLFKRVFLTLTRLDPEGSGSMYEARRCGLHQATEVAFVWVARALMRRAGCGQQT
jgi:hypothetical protein